MAAPWWSLCVLVVIAVAACPDLVGAGISPVGDASVREPAAVPLDSWQGALMPVIGKLSLLDLSLPGTHDTLTYDLSTKTSAGSVNDHEDISLLLRYLPFVRLVAGSWIRSLALAQYRIVTDQLNDGLRFLDLRLMQEPISKQWRSLHWVESNELFEAYIAEIRRWLDEHPSEIIVMSLTRHGQECATGERQYPRVNIDEKRKMWVSSIAETPIADLVARNHRVVIFASDREEFTGSSRYAYDVCRQYSWRSMGSPDNLPKAMDTISNFIQSATARNKVDRSNNRMTVMGLSTPVTDWHVKHLAWMKYWPLKRKEEEKKCCENFGIPEMSHCPWDLQELTTLNNYYNQLGLDSLLNDDKMELDIPAAVCIDQYGPAGTMTISMGADGKVSSFADILLVVTVRRACHPDGPHYDRAQADPAACETALAALRRRADQHPMQLWNEPSKGRHTNWP